MWIYVYGWIYVYVTDAMTGVSNLVYYAQSTIMVM